MYVKNLEQQGTTDFEFLGLRKTGRYWFPHWVKYIAWSLIATCVLGSSFILIFYGMSFGMIKTYLWLTGLVVTFIMGLVFFTPARICLIVFLDSLFFKLKPVIIRRRVYHSILSNPENEERKKRVENFRKYNDHLYRPLYYHALEARLDDIKYHVEMRNLTVEILAHSIFLFLLIYVVLSSVSSYGYNISRVLINLVANANYTGSIPLSRITTYDTFIYYVNETLLPALLQSYTTFYNAEPVNESDIYEKGWTRDHSLKLIGVPRMRQIRVNSDFCLRYKDIEIRNPVCSEELTEVNEEKRNFSLMWELTEDTGTYSENQIRPWQYQTAWESSTVSIVGQYSFYNGGGYMINFARSLDDSRIILDFVNQFQWIDTRTRVVVIEFTLYCVNTNTFIVSSIIAEKSAVGYFISSFEIIPCKFTFTIGELEMIYIITSLCLGLLLFVFLCREGLRIRRTSCKEYIKRPMAMIDFIVVIIGTINLTSMILQNYYVKYLLRELEDSSNNKFISFSFAGYWSKVGVAFEAILICLGGFKLFRLLTYRVLFFQLQLTLYHSWQNFINLILKTFALLLAFTMFFYLTLLSSYISFSSWAASLSTMIGLTVALDDDFNFAIFNEGVWYLPVMYYTVFVVFIPLLVVNLFIAIVCLYFHVIKRINLINKYSLLLYLKYILTRNEKSDVYQLQYDKHLGFKKKKKKKLIEDFQALENPMRLKGGGNKKSVQIKVPEENEKGSEENKKIPSEDGKITQENKKLLAEDGKITKENKSPTEEGKIIEENKSPTEEGKIIEENKKIPAGDKNISEENKKLFAEDGKITEENKKLLAEDGKITEENKKLLAEDGKITEENKKLLAEDGKITEENKKIPAGDKNISEEKKKKKNFIKFLFKKKDKEKYKKKKMINIKRKKKMTKIAYETIYVNEFAVRKPYDVTRYLALPLERLLAIKHLVIDFLSNDQEVKTKSRETAIKALYLYTNFPSSFYDNDRYFIVLLGDEEFPVRERLFDIIKKYTDDIGLSKNWVLKEIYDDVDFLNLKAEIKYLDETLSLIIEKMKNTKQPCRKKKKPICECPE